MAEFIDKITIFDKSEKFSVSSNRLINFDFEIDGHRSGMSISIRALMLAVRSTFPLKEDNENFYQKSKEQVA